MILLALESATDAVGAAVVRGEGGGAERVRLGGRAHAESLVPMIEEVCALEGCSIGDVGAISVDVGPGLFTGLRVGVATAKALAQALGIGVVGVGSLDVLAAAAVERSGAGSGAGRDAVAAGPAGPVAAVVDARRGEVFAAVYHFGRAADPVADGGPDGGLPGVDPAAVREDRPEPMSPAALEAWLTGTAAAVVTGTAGHPARMTVVGDGAVRYRELLSAHRTLDLGLATELASPPPLVQARLARRRLAAGAVPSDAAGLVPDYRRVADARINWVQRIPERGGVGP